MIKIHAKKPTVKLNTLLTISQKTEITNYINMLRTKNQVGNLIWDDNIALFSQNWSDHLLSTNLFQHSGTQLYGENLAYFQGYGVDIMILLKLSVNAWYNEIKLYDFNNPGFSEATGHFSALVWKASTRFGMGISIDPTTSKTIISMNTSPPGNVTGPTPTDTINRFKINVLPPLPTPVPAPIPIPTPTPTPTPVPIPPKPVPIPPKPVPIPPKPVPVPVPPKPIPTPIIPVIPAWWFYYDDYF